jgi:hypothetical protein
VLGLLSVIKKDAVAALPHLDVAIDTLVPLVAQDDLAARLFGFVPPVLYKLRGVALVISGNLGAAKHDLERAIKVLEQLPLDQLSSEWRLELLNSYILLASALAQQRDVAGAGRVLDVAIRLAEACSKDSPSEHCWDLELVRARVLWGGLLFQKSDMSATIKVLIPALVPARRLELTEPPGELWGADVGRLYSLLVCCFIAKYHASYLTDEVLGPDGEPWAREAVDHCMVLIRREAKFAERATAVREALETIARFPVQDEEHSSLRSAMEAASRVR